LINLLKNDSTVLERINPFWRKRCHSFGELIGFLKMGRHERFSDGGRELIRELFLTHNTLFGESVLKMEYLDSFFLFAYLIVRRRSVLFLRMPYVLNFLFMCV